MSRLVFIFGRQGQDPSEKPADPAKENLLTTMTCKAHTAAFLGMTAQQYQPTGALRPRKGYIKSVLDLNNAPVNVTVPAGSIPYLPSSKAMAKTVILKTGAKATLVGAPLGASSGKNYRTIAMTFGSAVTVGQIAEFLAEMIPDTAIQRGAIAPLATEIFPQFTIKGGRTYPIGLKAAAEASTDVNAPATPAEQTALINLAK